MGVFYVLLLVPMVLQHFSVKDTGFDYKKKNQWALAFFFVFLTALIAMRYATVGSDTQNYIYYFNKFSEMTWSELKEYPLEYGFALFNKAISSISGEEQIFLAATAVTVSAMIYPTYRRLCTDAALTIVLFCTMSTFLLMFSGVRQMLAIGIGFLAYEFTRRKKLILFALAVLLAMLFHTSAFMLVFMYPLYHVKVTKNWLLFIVPLLVVVFVFNQPIFSFLSSILERYTEYEGGISATGAYTMLVLFIIFAVFSFLIPTESRMDRETVGLRNFLLLAVVLQMFVPLHFWAMRMNYYYIVFIPLLIPKIIACSNTVWSRVAVWGRHIMVVFFLLYFFFNAYLGDNLKVFPYRFFWET